MPLNYLPYFLRFMSPPTHSSPLPPPSVCQLIPHSALLIYFGNGLRRLAFALASTFLYAAWFPNKIQTRDVIFKLLRSPIIDSKESIPRNRFRQPM